MENPVILILAAGKGTRMKSALPKVLHCVAGMPLLGHVLKNVRTLSPQKIIVTIGHRAEAVRESFPDTDIEWVVQEQQLGTAHAVRSALPALAGCQGDLLIINGDTPAIKPETLYNFIAYHRQEKAILTLLSTRITPPTGYGRIVRTNYGDVIGIVEESDADKSIRVIDEINAGVYCIALAELENLLSQIRLNTKKNEYYLTDAVALARSQGKQVSAYFYPEGCELAGINTRLQLAETEKTIRDRLVHYWMGQGVTFIDPTSCWIAVDCQIAAETTIHPNVTLGANVVIETGCEIGPFCVIESSHIGPNSRVLPFAHLQGVNLENKNSVGPFVRLRPGTHLQTLAKIGNFCEIKKSTIGPESKVNHLSYIGDTTIGQKVNVGAGTITCNYDGVHKHQTIIGDGAFIGSGTQLVAPVTVGQEAIIGAGATITKNVPDYALAIARLPQRHIEEYRSKKQNLDAETTQMIRSSEKNPSLQE